jgi:hypothetical protein
MKGQVDNILTTNGDAYYDFGKLYQSILGYDLVLHGDQIDNAYIEINKKYFLFKCKENNLDIKYLTSVTKSLIFGTFPFLKLSDPKEKIWEFIKLI